MKPQPLPIKRRITAVIMLTSLTVMALTVASFIAYDIITFRSAMVEHLSTLARVVAANSTDPLAFKNVKDAANTLTSLRAEPEIIAAALYDADGRILVIYTNSVSVTQVPSSAETDRMPRSRWMAAMRSLTPWSFEEIHRFGP